MTTASAPLLEVDGLTVTFHSRDGEVRAVSELSFAVGAGESFGLVGESGSGKSTVLRAICGLAPTTAGRIRIAGRVLPTPRGRGVGYSTHFARSCSHCFSSSHSAGYASPSGTICRARSGRITWRISRW